MAKERSYDRQKLHRMSETHRKAARMLFDGAPNKDVATACGVTLARVSYWRASDCFKEYMGQLQERAERAVVGASVGTGRATALDIVKGKAELAAKRLTDMLEDENWNKLRASDKLGVIERCFRAMGIDKPDGTGTAIQIVIQQSDLDRAAQVKAELVKRGELPGELIETAGKAVGADG